MAFEPKYLQPNSQSEKPLIAMFLGKNVAIQIEKDLEVKGKLVRYEFGNKDKPHRPNVLIVQNGSDKLIIRGNWLSLKTEFRLVQTFSPEYRHKRLLKEQNPIQHWRR